MTSAREELNDKVEAAIANPQASDKMWRTMARARNARANGILEHQINVEELKEHDRHIKAGVSADPELVQRFAEAVRRNGGQVYLAKTAEDANRYVAELAKRTGTKLLVKSKSLTTEEMEFNHYLENEGVKCVETD